MPLVSALSATSPILHSLNVDVPPQTPVAVEGINEPLTELVIPAADGIVLRPGDPGFNDLLPFNLRTTSRPMAIVECLTAAGASLAVKWARRHEIAACTHAGGHSYEGFSSCPGLMIDVRKMNQIGIDTANQTARLGAGCLLGDIAVALFEHKLALPAGSCRPVGVAGLALGGGHGLTSRKFGLTCDNLISAHVVTADGDELDANLNENSDLFWALRGGGGGNFGIVTEFTFKVHPVDRVIFFSITWPDDSFRTAVIRTWQNLVQSAPDELSFLLHVNGGEGRISHLGCNGLFLPRDASETPSVDDLRTVLNPLLSLGNPSFTPREVTYLEAAKILAGDGDPNRVFFKGKSDYSVEAWSDEAIQTFIGALRGASSQIATIFEAYGGSINRVGETETAFPHRGTLFCLQYFLQWTSSSSTNRNMAAVRAVYGAMRPFLPGDSYVNYIDADLQDYARSYYGVNLSRLQAVKQQYDPDNFFHFAQSIPLPGSDGLK
jgi:FAD binding domain/Berberine and berberine like